jgi:hypothetical protein
MCQTLCVPFVVLVFSSGAHMCPNILPRDQIADRRFRSGFFLVVNRVFPMMAKGPELPLQISPEKKDTKAPAVVLYFQQQKPDQTATSIFPALPPLMRLTKASAMFSTPLRTVCTHFS